jgi:hypothetical protein
MQIPGRKKPRPAAEPAAVDTNVGEVEAEREVRRRTALSLVRKRLIARRVPIRASNRHGWGQWLDEAHAVDGQWGRFGSSAGVQVLAITNERFGQTSSWQETVRDLELAIEQIFPEQVPEIPVPARHRHEPTDEDPDPWKHRDYAQPMKVAFCVEAVEPDCQTPVHGTLPPIVEHLISLRLPSDACWTTRPLDDPQHRHHDRVLVTAFSLYALRRFPRCHGQQRIADAYRWLANELPEPGVEVKSLCGLALAGARLEIRQRREIDQALKHCDRTLLKWVRENPTPIIERPWSCAYVDNESNQDYMFLSPETMIAMYFHERELTGEPAEYVTVVVDAIAANMTADSRTGARALRVQDTREGTVDQLWAVKLLLAHMQRSDASTLEPGVPQIEQRPTNVIVRAGRDWRASAIAIAAALGAVSAIVAAAVFAASAVVVAAAGVVGLVCGKILDAALDEPVRRLLRRPRPPGEQ